MRKISTINDGWRFIKRSLSPAEAATADGEAIDLPYSWNGADGQDGGNDYVRGAFWFVKRFKAPPAEADEDIYIEFKGVNSSALVYLNGMRVAEHHGGYSTFRANITRHLREENTLCVCADNRKNEAVYPQTADFTFYGGIYRDVNLITVNKNRFDLDYYGASGIK